MRLIDADELIKKFKYSDTHTEDENVWCATFRRMIKEQPTAYSIDKVVEELERLHKECDGRTYAYQRAIEIVKRGNKGMTEQEKIDPYTNQTTLHHGYEVDWDFCK